MTDGPDRPPRVPPVPAAAVAALLVAQLVLIFGDFGFDHPGRFGLDFGHLLGVGIIGLFAAVVGGGAAISSRRWWWLAGVFAAGGGLLPATVLGDLVSLHLYR